MKMRRLLLFFGLLWPLLSIQALPSASVNPGSYGVDLEIRLSGEGRLLYGFGETADSAVETYRVPLRLTAVPGESREYRLWAQEAERPETAQSFHFIIDKEPPGPVSILQEDGGVRFAIDENDLEIYYKLGQEPLQLWDGSLVPSVSETITAYAVDEAGNIGLMRSSEEVLFTRETSDLTVVSPVAGSYLNQQYLFLRPTGGYDWIRYSLDGSDPAIDGSLYSGPVKLDTRGASQLRIAAGRGEDLTYREEVLYEVDEFPAEILYPAGGIFQEAVTLTPPEDGFSYLINFGEGTAYGRDFNEDIRLEGIEGAEDVVVVTVFTEELSIAPFRGVYLIDRYTVDDVNDQETQTSRIRVVQERPGSASIESVGSLFYSLSTEDYRPLDAYSPLLPTTLNVEVPLGMRRDFYLTAGDPALSSNQWHREVITLDNRLPEVPQIEATSSGLVTITGSGRLYYSVDFASYQPYEEPFSLSLEDFPDTRHRFSIRAYSQGENGWSSDPAELETLVDRRIPRIISFEGLPSENLSFQTVVLRPLTLPEDTACCYSLSTEGVALDPVPGVSPDVVSGIELPGQENAVVRYSLKFLPYRNQTPGSISTMEIVIDRVPPGPPLVSGLPSGPINQAADVQFQAASVEDRLVLRIGNEELEGLTGYQFGQSAVFTLSAFDPAGNETVVGPFTLEIDTEKPAAPALEEERTIFYEDAVLLYLEREPGATVFYEIAFDDDLPEIPDVDSPSSEETIRIDLLGSEQQLHLRMLAIDNFGNIGWPSEVVTLPLKQDTAASANQTPSVDLPDSILNLPFKTVSRSAVTVRSVTDFIVRYELGTEEYPPQTVTARSPRLDDSLDLDLPPGRQHSWILAARAYRNDGSLALANEFVYRITVDKREPGTPRLNFSPPDANGRVRVEISGDGDRYYYRFETSAFINLQQDYREYDGPFFLEPEQGLQEGLSVESYGEDAAGNRSRTLVQEYTVEESVIYVSSQGNDFYPGTRSMPVRSIEKALGIAAAQGKNTLYLSSGLFIVHNPLILDRNIRLVGGFSGSDWSAGGGYTLLKTGPYYEENGAFLSVDDASVTVEGIVFSDEIASVEPLISLESGFLHLSRVSFPSILSEANEGFLQLHEGNMKLSRLDIDITGTDDFVFLRGEGGNLYLSQAKLTGRSRGGDISLLKLEGLSSFRLEDSTLTIDEGIRQLPLELVDCPASVLSRSTLATDNAVISARNLVVNNSLLSIQQSSLQSGRGNRIGVNLRADDSLVQIHESRLDAAAQIGGTGLDARRTRLYLTNCRLETSSTPYEFIYPFVLTSSDLEAMNNLVVIPETRDAIFVQCRDSGLSLFHNTVTLEDSDRIILIDEEGYLRSHQIANNIFAVVGPGSGSSLFWKVDRRILEDLVLHNDIADFDQIVSSQERPADNLLDFNLMDGDPYFGNLSDNFEEDPRFTFGEDYRLLSGSACIDAGTDRIDLNLPLLDYDSEMRPAGEAYPRPLPDAGFDEYH